MSTDLVTYNGPDNVSKAMLTELAAMYGEWSKVNAQLAAADGDRNAAITAWIESSDHPEAVKLRGIIEQAETKLTKLAEAEVVEVTLSDEEKAKLEANRTALVDRLKVGQATVKQIATSINKDAEGVLKALEAFTAVSPVSGKRGRKPGFVGSNAPRVSVNVTMSSDENPNDVKSFDSLSKVASYINTETADVQKAFAEAAGVAYENIKTVDKPVTFTYQTPGHRLVWTINTTPKPRKNSAATAASTTPTPVTPEPEATAPAA